MIQLVLTYAILTLVSGYVLFKLYRMIFRKKEVIGGCGSDCSCDAVEVKKEILELKLKNNH